ncbi:MAG TPA: hypothetical protein PKD85_03420, partial [Saprospiraceae bacterium]|nr:hypothetical protein [Saprospiraceae bacterium]
MKHIFILLISFNTAYSFAQKNDDKKIIITFSDTGSIKQKAKEALIKNDFILKETGNQDTIITYPRE